MEAGMLTNALPVWLGSALIETVIPFVGAAIERVTVAVAELPPETTLGLMVSDVTEATCARTVSVPRVVAPPGRVAVIVTVVFAGVVNVVTLNVPVELPAGIVTVASGCATPGKLLTSEIVAPLAGAGAPNTIVPVEF